MLELLTIVIFVWMMIKAVGLALKITWGVAKIIAAILMLLALPLLLVCVIFLGGIALIAPIALIGIAFCVLKACV